MVYLAKVSLPVKDYWFDKYKFNGHIFGLIVIILKKPPVLKIN